MYIWMLQWKDLDHRAKCFGSLYSDPEWERIRVSTNGMRDTVIEQRILIMRHLPCHASLANLKNTSARQEHRLHELRIQRLQYGLLGASQQQMEQVDLPAWDRCGASHLGVFEIISGAPVPSIAHFMSWESFEARKEGMRQFEVDPLVSQAREAEVKKINNHYLQEFDDYLLEPMPFAIPRPLLALNPNP